MPESLSPVEPGNEWLSAHLFFSGNLYSKACDHMVLQTVAPIVEEVERQERRWFFIRYGEEGFHVRLRIFGPPSWLADEMWPTIERIAATAPTINRLTFAEYEPEVDRYGGPHGVALAEELFHHSSVTALALLRRTELGNRSALLGKAVLAMLVLLHVFFDRRQEAAAHAEIYGKSYLRLQVPHAAQQEQWLAAFEEGFDRQSDRLARYVAAAWSALDEEEEMTPELDGYRDRMKKMASSLISLFENRHLFEEGKVARDWSAVQRRIVSSYLHMMNNRLGVSIRDECYLAVLISQALGMLQPDE